MYMLCHFTSPVLSGVISIVWWLPAVYDLQFSKAGYANLAPPALQLSPMNCLFQLHVSSSIVIYTIGRRHRE